MAWSWWQAAKWPGSSVRSSGRLGHPLFDRKVTKITARKIALETDAPVWPQADGEPPPAKGACHVEFEVLPQKARLWVTH